MKTLLPFAALAALLPLTPIQAETPTRTQVVAYADLDLASADGRAKLDRRIKRAAAEVCGTASDFDLVGLNDVQSCRTLTADAALTQARAQTAGNRAVQVATITR